MAFRGDLKQIQPTLLPLPPPARTFNPQIDDRHQRFSPAKVLSPILTTLATKHVSMWRLVVTTTGTIGLSQSLNSLLFFLLFFPLSGFCHTVVFSTNQKSENNFLLNRCTNRHAQPSCFSIHLHFTALTSSIYLKTNPLIPPRSMRAIRHIT